MKKDYVYQDKGQYKLLQNAERIGGFYAGDQGIVPAERVLPEQRFAHQPIFRRPPEEILNYAYGTDQGKLIYCLDRGIGPEGTEHWMRAKKLIKMKDPLDDGALEVERKFIKGQPLSGNESIILDKNFLWSARKISNEDIFPPHLGLWTAGQPILFDNFYFYLGAVAYPPPYTDYHLIIIHNFINKTSVDSGIIGLNVAGQFSIEGLCLVYKENTNYKLIFHGWHFSSFTECYVKCTATSPQETWSVEQVYLRGEIEDFWEWAINSLFLPIIQFKDTKDFATHPFLPGYSGAVYSAYYESFKNEIEERLGPPNGLGEARAFQYPFSRKGDPHEITVKRSSTIWGLNTKRVNGKNTVFRGNAKYVIDFR